VSGLPCDTALFWPASGGLTAAGPVNCSVSSDNWLLVSTLEEVLGSVGGEVGLVGDEVGLIADEVELVVDEAEVEDEMEV